MPRVVGVAGCMEEEDMDRSGTDRLIVDDRDNGVFRVNRRVFTDPEILERERRQVFDRSWLYAGHASEIPKPGDFITRRVGGRPLILVRDSNGEPRAMLNTCPHRGNMVCQGRSGTAQRFTCFYHAWTFDLQGALVGVPGEDAYTSHFVRSEMGMSHVPRMETYRGMIFVSYDPAIVDLVTYLGEAKPYLDYALEFGVDDLEIVEGSQEYSMQANWKLLVENSIDGYHAMSTHRRYFTQYLPDLGLEPVHTGASQQLGVGVDLGNGHSMVEGQLATPIAAHAKEELARKRKRLEERYGPERAHKIADYTRNLFIFPNLVMISIWHTVRTFYPIAPDYMEINAWAILPKNESRELRHRRLENFLGSLGPAGFATPDDVAALEGCQRGFACAREVAWSDISRGMANEQPSATDELQMRAFWRRWSELVCAEEGASRGAAATSSHQHMA